MWVERDEEGRKSVAAKLKSLLLLCWEPEKWLEVVLLKSTTLDSSDCWVLLGVSGTLREESD